MITEKQISFKIDQQFPALYREHGSELVDFIKEYYKFLETETNQSLYNSRRLYDYKDISDTTSQFIVYFHKKFMADLPLLEDKSARVALKNIMDLYRRKGTSGGIKLFFRLFYDETVDIKYPAEQMFKVSASDWRQGIYLQMFPNDNKFYDKDQVASTYQSLIGKNVRGSISDARAAVDKINFIILNKTLTPILYISDVRGQFKKFDDIIATVNGKEVAFGRVYGSPDGLTIDTTYAGTAGNNKGDIFNIVADSGNGGGGRAIVTDLVTELTGRVDYTLLDGGFGYSANNTMLDVSNQTIVLDNEDLVFTIEERLTDTAGNIGKVIGQNDFTVGVKMEPGDDFDIARTISTLDRSPNVTINSLTGSAPSIISVKNESSPGPLFPDTGLLTDVRVNNLVNKEVVSLIFDKISDFTAVVINASNYNDPPALQAMSGTADPVTLATPLNQAFDLTPFEIGTIESFANINPGANYINDVYAIARDPIMANFDRYEQIIILDNISASMSKGDTITQSSSGGVADPEYNNGAIIDLTGDGSNFFSREVTVNGVRIVAAGTVGGQTAVPDAFVEKVARMFELFTDPNGAGINEASQRTFIKTLSGDAGTYHAAVGPTLQRVARGAGADYTPNFLTDTGIASYNLSPLFDSHVANDMVWYLNSTGDAPGDGDNDAQEVIEHVFHTLHMHGLDAVSLKMYSSISSDWASGPLYAAMEEAYDAGKWDSSGYGGNAWKTDGDAFEVAAKEYLFLLNFGMFEYSSLWDGGSLSPEWTDDMRTQSGIQANNPLGYALHNTYIAPVISKPSLTTIRNIFQDGDVGDPTVAGASGYVVTSVGGGGGGVSGVITDVNSAGNFIKVRPFSYYGFDRSGSITHKGVNFAVSFVVRDYNSKKLGESAEVFAETNFAVGRIKEADIYNSGYGYVDGDTVYLTNDDGERQAKATLSATSQGITSGYWASFNSHLSGYRTDPETNLFGYFDSGMKVQDSDYYQEYSYEIQSIINKNLYEEAVTDSVHLAGTKMFGKFDYNRISSTTLGFRLNKLIKEDFEVGGDPIVGPDQVVAGAGGGFRVDTREYSADSVQISADMTLNP
jgi:hypothetical protein